LREIPQSFLSATRQVSVILPDPIALLAALAGVDPDGKDRETLATATAVLALAAQASGQRGVTAVSLTGRVVARYKRAVKQVASLDITTLRAAVTAVAVDATPSSMEKLVLSAAAGRSLAVGRTAGDSLLHEEDDGSSPSKCWSLTTAARNWTAVVFSESGPTLAEWLAKPELQSVALLSVNSYSTDTLFGHVDALGRRFPGILDALISTPDYSAKPVIVVVGWPISERSEEAMRRLREAKERPNVIIVHYSGGQIPSRHMLADLCVHYVKNNEVGDAAGTIATACPFLSENAAADMENMLVRLAEAWRTRTEWPFPRHEAGRKRQITRLLKAFTSDQPADEGRDEAEAANALLYVACWSFGADAIFLDESNSDQDGLDAAMLTAVADHPRLTHTPGRALMKQAFYYKDSGQWEATASVEESLLFFLEGAAAKGIHVTLVGGEFAATLLASVASTLSSSADLNMSFAYVSTAGGLQDLLNKRFVPQDEKQMEPSDGKPMLVIMDFEESSLTAEDLSLASDVARGLPVYREQDGFQPRIVTGLTLLTRCDRERHRARLSPGADDLLDAFHVLVIEDVRPEVHFRHLNLPAETRQALPEIVQAMENVQDLLGESDISHRRVGRRRPSVRPVHCAGRNPHQSRFRPLARRRSRPAIRAAL
jgi:hypothetical protein